MRNPAQERFGECNTVMQKEGEGIKDEGRNSFEKVKKSVPPSEERQKTKEQSATIKYGQGRTIK